MKRPRTRRDRRNYKDPLRQYHPATAVILSGYRSRLSEGAVKPPVFRSSTFEFPNAEAGATNFKRAYHLPGADHREPELIYSRLNNPNTEIAEDKLVAAEMGAKHAALFPSGMSAITTTILALVPKGGKILCTDPVYGGTYLFLKEFCPKRFGIETHSVDTSRLEKVREAIRKDGPFDMILIETPSNPTLSLTDIRSLTGIVRRMGGKKTIIAVDNTFLGPVFQHPFLLGADLVLYSATKFIGGHSDILAGVVLSKNGKPMERIRDYRTILGAATSPDTSWLLTRSIETVWIRMLRQSEKALKVARALRKHPKIRNVLFPGLLSPSDGEAFRIYKGQCTGPGAMISFHLKKASRPAAFRFLNAVRIFHLAVSLGGTESLMEHPRSMTHSDMTTGDLDRSGIGEGMIRLSIGLESSDDLIEDLKNALKQV